MRQISFAKLLACGLIAALFGSTIGTALLLSDEMLGHPLRHFLGEPGWYDRSPASDWKFYPFIWYVSAFGTIPGSLLIGAPALYPFRNVISRHPFFCVLPVLGYAAAISTFLLGWMVTPTASGEREYDVIWFYSASSALGFVVALGWSARRSHYVQAESRDASSITGST